VELKSNSNMMQIFMKRLAPTQATQWLRSPSVRAAFGYITRGNYRTDMHGQKRFWSRLSTFWGTTRLQKQEPCNANRTKPRGNDILTPLVCICVRRRQAILFLSNLKIKPGPPC